MDALAQRLRTERERQNLSVRDLAIVTKIREPYIQALERGAYDVLPAVYVRSFVKTLASALGIPQREIHALMDDVFDIDEATPDRIPRAKPPEPERPDLLASTMQVAGQAFSAGAQKAGKALTEGVDRLKDIAPPTFFRQRPKGLVIIAAAIALLLVIAAGWWLFSGPSDADEAASAPQNEIDVGGLVDSLMEEDASLADSMELRVEVTDTAWLTITMDGARTQQLTLLPGDEHAWRAAERFKFSLSNAGAVRFFRNDQALPLFGQVGQAVREVVITRKEVISSTRPVEQPAQRSQSASAPSRPQRQRATTPAPRQRQRTTSRDRRSIPLITPAPTQNPDVRPSQPR